MSLKTMMNSIRKSTNSISYNESKLSRPTGYIDTGCLAVNRIISGNIYNGIPEGRITTFYGESGCVPFNRNLRILVKVNASNSKYLFTKTDNFSASEFTVSYSEKIKWLEQIGYSLCEISRNIKLSRQTLEKIKNNKLKGEIRFSTKSAIDNFIDRNTYLCEIGDINVIMDSSVKTLIHSKNGFVEHGHLIKKGLKQCILFSTFNNRIIECSDDHMIMSNKEWKFAQNIEVSDVVESIYGSETIVSKIPSGEKECFDIEIFNDDHCYFIDGILSHNSGKSRIVAQIIINSILKNNYDIVFYFDSEGGGLYDFIKNSGVDMSKIEHVLIASTEEAASKMLITYKNIEEENENCIKENKPLPKILCVLDSFGMLVSNKLLVDATEKDKMVSDMGSAARLKNNFIKAMTIPVLKTNAALIIINHVYDNPNQMYSSKIKDQPGGKGLQFASHIIVQSSKSLQRDKVEGLDEGESYFKGNDIRYFTVKNRLVKLGYEANMFVDLNYGISKYDGLVDDARRYGFITGGVKGKYKVPSYSDKCVTMKQILTDDNIWNTFIDKFNEKSEKDMQYGSGGSIMDGLNASEESEGVSEEDIDNDSIDDDDNESEEL